MRLQARDLAVLHAASTDETRFNLNTVRFDTEAGRLYATNGHVLAWVPMPDADEGEVKLESFSLARADAERLVKDTKVALKGVHPQLRDEFGAQLAVEESNGNGAAIVRLPGSLLTCEKVVEGEYPDVDKIIPSTDGWMEVGIGVAVLETILKVVRARGTGKVLKFQFDLAIDARTGLPNATLSAFRVSAGGPALEFVGMPMRL